MRSTTKTVECGHSDSGHYVGKNPALIFDASPSFGTTVRHHMAWYMFRDGKKFTGELYDDIGVAAIPMGNTGGQMFGRFRRQIKTPSDFPGVRCGSRLRRPRARQARRDPPADRRR
jgi:TRAP-type mannitol/chloroaromatic compound transport system substrate-binding protein